MLFRGKMAGKEGESEPGDDGTMSTVIREAGEAAQFTKAKRSSLKRWELKVGERQKSHFFCS